MDNTAQSKPLAYWLFFSAFMVFAMMVIGAITRLSGSGLSMVEWRPLIGALPPMNEAEWSRVFALYQESPQYHKENFWMELEDFKTIFFWEWFHRLWGRLIGLAFALPLAFFWIRNMIPQGYHLKLLTMLVLGGLQGLMGWYMVKSGLVDVPAVSHFRLAAHLGLAFVIAGLLLWLGLSLLPNIQKLADKGLFMHTLFTLGLISVTIIWGAFTAGMDAGLVYNDTFPKMGEHWIPEDFWKYDTAWMNIIQNHSSIQFSHRWLAILSVAVIFSLWLRAILKHNTFPALHLLFLMSFLQLGLGIATLMSGVHLHVAATHQAGAIIVFSLLVLCAFRTRPEK